MGRFWNFQFTFTFAFSPKMPTECPFPFAFTFSELTFMNAIHELGQLLISAQITFLRVFLIYAIASSFFINYCLALHELCPIFCFFTSYSIYSEYSVLPNIRPNIRFHRIFGFPEYSVEYSVNTDYKLKN
jgi:hypothetical protein